MVLAVATAKIEWNNNKIDGAKKTTNKQQQQFQHISNSDDDRFMTHT